MRFRRGATARHRPGPDARGRGGAGGLALGGGGLGLIGLVIYLLISLLSGGGGLGQLAPLDDRSVGQGDTPGSISQDCRTGEDANQRQDCRIVAVVNSVQKFWNGVFTRSNRKYSYVDTVFFTDQIQTGCGSPARRSARSTARPTSSSTSTSASSTTSSPGSASGSRRSRRRT